MQIHWEGNAGSININGTVFVLKQSHWHSPSEHTINGRRSKSYRSTNYSCRDFWLIKILSISNEKTSLVSQSKNGVDFRNYIPYLFEIWVFRYSLELHMVHKSIDPTSKHQIAVIGVLYKIGKPNPFLTKVNSWTFSYQSLESYEENIYRCIILVNVSIQS